jgi:prephenate dehydrogenase
LGEIAVRGASPFEHIGIVGLGLVGGSVALAARRAWPSVTISALDPAPITHEAVSQGAITAVVDRVDQLAACDLIVIAVPVLLVPSLLGDIGRTGTTALVTDTSSTKRVVMDAAKQTKLSFVGGHPVAGSEQSGLAAARADLFDGKPWLLVSTRNGGVGGVGVEGGNGGVIDELEAREAMLTTFTVGLGAKPSWTDAVTHDRVMAHVSHAPQVVSTALMAASGEAVGAEGVEWSGRGFADMTRLASSSSDVWQGILETNADFIADALTGIAAKLPTSSQALMDAPTVRALFDRARALKQPASQQ